MFLPSSVRLLSIGLYLNIAWTFLSIAAIVFVGGIGLVLDRRIEAVVMFAIGPLFLYVGSLALERLRSSLDRSHPGL